MTTVVSVSMLQSPNRFRPPRWISVNIGVSYTTRFSFLVRHTCNVFFSLTSFTFFLSRQIICERHHIPMVQTLEDLNVCTCEMVEARKLIIGRQAARSANSVLHHSKKSSMVRGLPEFLRSLHLLDLPCSYVAGLNLFLLHLHTLSCRP